MEGVRQSLSVCTSPGRIITGMVFSSFQFLHLFIPLTLIVVLTGHKLAGPKLANPLLLLASTIFYMWGIGASFAPILFASIAVNYCLGLWADQQRRKQQGSTFWPVLISVIANLSLLAYFKYANFFVEQLEPVRAMLGFDALIWENVILPIGISFFTFQSMSYVFDIAAGRARVLRNPLDFALYVALFPQLIAGPIVRYGLISEQLKDRQVDLHGMKEGAMRFLHGLVKKVVIADAAGAIADAVFSMPASELTMGAAWLGAVAYTVQIYFDFSGYSDMAIGLGRMFGFKFPENFNRPYTALSITDFWRRWHMTLSNWFRDYVYIPMGGSRFENQGRIYFNLWVIFFLTGIWHGANWTFIVWGLYHGGLLALERMSNLRVHVSEQIELGFMEYLLRRSGVIFMVLLGWVMFRASSLDYAVDFYQAMFTLGDFSLPLQMRLELSMSNVAFMLLGVYLAFLLPPYVRGPLVYRGRFSYAASIALVVVAYPFAMMKIMAGTYSPFLYFQF